MVTLPARILAVLVALALAVSLGWRMGVKSKQGEWDAAELERRVADEETRRLNRKSMDGAAAQFEAQRRAQEIRRASTSPEARSALGAPICPPGAASAALGDLRIPAAIARGLRDAGADLDPPGAAVSKPGR